MAWIGFFLVLLFHPAIGQDDMSNHGYNDSANTYFTYHKFPYENCESATQCSLLKKIVRPETIENVFVCHLSDTITPRCPIPEDNICVCVRDRDCQEIYDILDRKNSTKAIQKIHDVKNEYQNCGFEDFVPKYCCPYPKIESTGEIAFI